jgi:rfaE bifunctional protein nucleotidyltransferase chain/domain
MTTTVFTNGVFDLLHIGHLRLLQFARAQGDRLIVGINSDESVTRLKGPSRPIFPASERKEMLEHLRWVNDVFVFDEDSPARLIEELRPDILVKGTDWLGRTIRSRAVIESWGGRVIIAPDFGTDHTTTIVDRIKSR